MIIVSETWEFMGGGRQVGDGHPHICIQWEAALPGSRHSCRCLSCPRPPATIKTRAAVRVSDPGSAETTGGVGSTWEPSILQRSQGNCFRRMAMGAGVSGRYRHLRQVRAAGRGRHTHRRPRPHLVEGINRPHVNGVAAHGSLKRRQGGDNEFLRGYDWSQGRVWRTGQ